MLKRLGFIAFTALVALSACNRESDDKYANDPSGGYFPVRLGHYVTYNLDSTIYNDFDCTVKTKHYQMRYDFADTFRDASNRLSYRIETYIRSYDTLPWTPKNVEYCTVTPGSVEYVNNTLRFIKLVFPVQNGKTWKGNAMIATNDQDLSYFADWNYQYLNINEEYNQDSVMFGNTVIVQQVDEKVNDPESFPTAYAYKTYGREVFAYDIGMVYKKLTHWVYDPGTTACRNGYSVEWRAIDYKR